MFDAGWLPVDSSKSVQSQVRNDYHTKKIINNIQTGNKSMAPGNPARSDLH